MKILLTIAAIAVVVMLAAWWRERRLHQRPRVLSEILDLADALERELLECRARMREIPALTANLTSAGHLSAHATLTAEPQVQDALRDLLAHRLWLKEHADTATIESLQAARDALTATRTSLARQLARLADVRTDFEQSCNAQAALPANPRR